MAQSDNNSNNNKRPRESNEKDEHDKEHENKDDWKKQPPYAPEDPKKPKKALFKGNCHCHDVTFEIYVDKPKGAHFCHCDTCQKLHGSATHWSVVIPKNEVLFTCSPDKLSFYRTEDQKTEHIPPCKLSCARCHSPIADEGRNMMLMYPSTFNFEKKEDRSPFLPDKHIFYAQRAIDVEDGTAKWEGMPDDSKQLYEEHEHGQKGVAGSGSKKD
ncbi:hypothetical protein P389DRAFT_166905 [Cystobasidium minutum MCA 4210]|uniref:uncharacterized protein n=1 Tax=Cystobasidium minutum MCA 4210 TaxID=1397322 RepID=UPI0034CE9F63|eukprot:jgi/Rhomi1/166905/fgenesh1_kg.2_\